MRLVAPGLGREVRRRDPACNVSVANSWFLQGSEASRLPGL